MAETLEERKKRHHQEDLQRLRGFRPIDDTFMRCLFRNNVPLAEMVLRIITGKNDLQLVSCETQADLKRVTRCEIYSFGRLWYRFNGEKV